MPDDDEVQFPPILLPGYESRQQARAIIVLAVMVDMVAALLFVAAPGSFGPMLAEPPPFEPVIPLIGLGMHLVGLAWMVRIYRTSVDVEPDHGNWRYRSR